jgi:hypothetical protein
MMPEITTSPLTQAVAHLGAKTPIGAALRSADWEKVPLALRQRAQFSATLEDVRVLAEIKAKLGKAIGLQREKVAGGEAFVDRSSFIGDMRKVMQEAGLGDNTGAITDLGSRARLGLIYDMQIQQAQEFARFKVDQNEDVLNQWPAQELIREEEPKGGPQARRDWSARWKEAGGQVKGGRMAALKTDPIWSAISRFGTPWPPFDFGSGMGLRDIDRDEAEQLGLLLGEDRRGDERVVTQAFSGVFESDPQVRERFLRAI